jgi:hypothetical protein
MATVATSYERQISTGSRPRQQLRRLLGGAAVFDAGMGIACLAAADAFSGWLSISTAAVRTTSIVFFVAAAAGAYALRAKPVDVRGVTAANLLFALWCLGLIAVESPGTLGDVLLVGAAATSGATAAAEHWLARR